MPILFAPTPPVGKINKIVPISEGGTGGASIAEAMANLGAIAANTINQPNGPLGLDANGKLTIDTSAVSLSAGPAISGPTSVEVGTSTNYQITNFHAPTVYSVTAITGSVVQNGETITYTAPGNSGSGGFIINGKTYNINVTQKAPQTPTISTPVNGATNIGSTVSVTSSAFTMTSGTDTHAASHWQISTSSNFATILYESLDDTVNKTSWSKGPLTVSTTYYVRVRYKGTTYGYSGWSNVVSFSTKSSFVANSEQAKLVPEVSNQYDNNGDRYIAITNDGNTLITGGPNHMGKGQATIFVRSGSSWTVQARLLASDGVSGDYFGWSVSISSDGNTAIIGAMGVSQGRGAAYIFVRSGNLWVQQTKLLANDGVGYVEGSTAADYFGWSVSISEDGNSAVIGAYNKTFNAKGGFGVAYIFTRSSGTWTQQVKLTTNDTTTLYFGNAVAISKDSNTVVVCAYGSSSNKGSAFVFAKSGSTWTEQAKLTASDGQAGYSFGESVGISSNGNTIIIGSSYKNGSVGSAYVFIRDSFTWFQQAILTATDTDSVGRFGFSTNISPEGDHIVVGALTTTTSGIANAGSAYVFLRSGTTWAQVSKLTASDKASDDNFGSSVCITSNGSMVGVGAPLDDYNGKVDAGSAYIFA